MPNKSNSTKKDSPEITPPPNKNLETHIMEARYQRAWEVEFAKLDDPLKNRVMDSKTDESKVDPAVSAFFRRVIGLAESDERI